MQKNYILALLFVFLIAPFAYSQTPDAFSYQAVVRDANGAVLSNQTVIMRISIVRGSANGSLIYRETHQTTTNTVGLVNLEIGRGQEDQPSPTPPDWTVFSAIDWGAGSHYVGVEMSTSGTSGFVSLGNNELLSVPYALHAKNVSSSGSADNDPQNEIQDLELIGNDLKVTNNPTATQIDLTQYLDNTDAQAITLLGDILTLSNGGTVDLSKYDDRSRVTLVAAAISNRIQNDSTLLAGHIDDDNDTSATNEIINTFQMLGDSIMLSEAGQTFYVDLNQFEESVTIIDTSNAIRSYFNGVISDLNVRVFNDSNRLNPIEDAAYKDTSSTNELLTSVSLSGNNLLITDAGNNYTIDLSPLNDSLQIVDSIADIRSALVPLEAGAYKDSSNSNELLISGTLAGNILQLLDNGGTTSINLLALNDSLQITDSIANVRAAISILNNGAYKDSSSTNELLTSGNLSGNNLELVDNGGTTTIDLSALNDSLQITDSIADIRTALAPLEAGAYKDSSSTNELITNAAITGNNLEITDAGGTQTVDLSALNDSIQITDSIADVRTSISTLEAGAYKDSSSTNEIQALSLSNDTVYLTNGGFVVLPAPPANFDNDSTNEYLDSLYILNDSMLVVSQANGAFLDTVIMPSTTDLFENASGVVRTSSGYDTYDFLFGSPQLNDNGNTSNDSRMFFDKSKGAIRAGNVIGTQWNEDSVGQYSVAFGANNKAIGVEDVVGGGASNTARGGQSTVAGGTSNSANALRSTIAGGGQNTVNSQYGFIGGGQSNTVNGIRSSVLGGNINSATGGMSAVTGGHMNVAVGDGSSVIGGYRNKAQSYSEVVLGLNNDTLTSGFTTNSFVATDRLFVIGNGTAANTRSNALVMLKNGNTTLNGLLTLSDGSNPFTLPNADGTNGQVLKTDGSGNVTWQNSASYTTKGLDSILAVGKDAANDSIYNLDILGVGTNVPTSNVDVLSTTPISVNITNNVNSASDKKGLFSNVSGGLGGENFGLYGKASGSTTENHGVYGEASGASGTNYGIFGTASGSGTNWAGYFEQGDVFIEDTLKADEIIVNSAYTLPNYDGDDDWVMTTDGLGNVNWEPQSSGPWDVNGLDTIYTDKKVGIGTDEPLHALEIHSSDDSVGAYIVLDSVTSTSTPTGFMVDMDGTDGTFNNDNTAAEFYTYGSGNDNLGLYASAEDGTNNNIGIIGEADAGNITSTIGATGIYGFANGLGDVYGIFGEATNGNNNYAIYGNATGSGNNWAGYFDTGNVRIRNTLILAEGIGSPIGITGPSSVTSGYTLTLPNSAPTAGQVLESDATGVLSWTSPSNTDTSLFLTNNARSSNLFVDNDTMKFTLNGSEKITIDHEGRLGLNMKKPVARICLWDTVNNAINDVGISSRIYSNLVDSAFGYKAYVYGDATNKYGVYSVVSGVSPRYYATYSKAEGSGLSSDYYGAYNIATGNGGSAEYYATYSSATGGAGNDNYGLYSTASGGAINWAGYFDAGDVKITNSLILAEGLGTSIGIKGPGTVTSGFTLTLPSTAPTAGQILESDATGVLSWTSASSLFSADSTRIKFTNGSLQTSSVAINTTTDLIEFTEKGTLFFRMSNGVLHTLNSGRNVSIGEGAGSSLDYSSNLDNVFIGYNAGNSVTTNSSNVGIGFSALTNAGSRNTALGYQAANTHTGSNNVAIGEQSLRSGSGANNVAVGRRSLNSPGTGAGNTAVGTNALNSNSGSNNVAVGNAAGQSSTGSNNVLIGFQAGQTESNSNRLHIANTSSKSLIYGEFDNDSLRIDGSVRIVNDLYVDSVNATEGFVLSAGADGQALWKSLADLSTCPTGMSDVGSYCIHTAEQSAENWFIADSTCAALGFELSSYSDWYGATSTLSLTDETDDWEWVSNMSNNNMMVVGNATAGTPGIRQRAARDPEATTAPFRCVIRK